MCMSYVLAYLGSIQCFISVFSTDELPVVVANCCTMLTDIHVLTYALILCVQVELCIVMYPKLCMYTVSAVLSYYYANSYW